MPKYDLMMTFTGGRPGYEYDYNGDDYCVPCGEDEYSIGSDDYEMCSPCLRRNFL